MCKFRRFNKSLIQSIHQDYCEQYLPIQDLFANSVQAATNPLVRLIVFPNLANNSNASMAPLCGRYINVCRARDRRPASIKVLDFGGFNQFLLRAYTP